MALQKITVEDIVRVPREEVWNMWTAPEHITAWNFAADDWYCPSAENDVRAGGKFKIAMAARNGSEGFDFEGVYTNIVPYEVIEYEMPDGRKVTVQFEDMGDMTRIIETFDPETMNSPEMQKEGWQAILGNFKKYAEINA